MDFTLAADAYPVPPEVLAGGAAGKVVSTTAPMARTPSTALMRSVFAENFPSNGATCHGDET